MFKEDTSVFFSDFADVVTYSTENCTTQIKAIVDFDVNLIGFEGEVAANTTTFTTDSYETIAIGGTFNYQGDNYVIDGIVSDDKTIKVVSAVKE